jgi:hypothetical protein
MLKGLWKEWCLIDKFILSIERSPVAALNPGAKPSDRVVASEVSLALDQLFKVCAFTLWICTIYNTDLMLVHRP